MSAQELKCQRLRCQHQGLLSYSQSASTHKESQTNSENLSYFEFNSKQENESSEDNN